MGLHDWKPSKNSIIFFYLETGSLTMSFIISIRRMIYFLKTLSMRNEEDLTKRILEEQNKNPTPGDFVELVENDFMKIVKTLL